jgi:hypothetical protein
MDQTDHAWDIKELNRWIEIGVAQADRGEFVEFTAENIIREGPEGASGSMWHSRPRLCSAARRKSDFDLRSNTAEGGCATRTFPILLTPALTTSASA